MRLSELLKGDNGPPAGLSRDVEVTGLSADSRTVRPGFVFAAIKGTQSDGREFVGDAIEAGAIAVLGPPDLRDDRVDPTIPVLTDANPRRALAHMAARFFGVQPKTVVGVTGTNGKTSVASFTQQLWRMLGKPAATMGTLGVRGPGLTGGPSLTTPDPVELQRILADLAAQGIDHLALEASSHGLDQFRLDGVLFEAAAFTNLTRDHLDYHGTEEAYRAAKSRLFAELLPPGAASVLNADSPECAALRRIAKSRDLRILTYGMNEADIACTDARPTDDGWDLTLNVSGETYETRFPLPGRFQVANMLCALGLVLACGGKEKTAVSLVASLKGVPGRLEEAARLGNGATVLVDYAHTPDALETVLDAVRPHVRNKLVAVFGCGGDRDRGKRPEMGRIAAERADLVYVTDDNPRSEDADAIRREILAACPDARDIGDRRAAIAEAMHALNAGDMLVIAGKGHEEGQIVGDTVLPFNDIDVARTIAEDLS